MGIPQDGNRWMDDRDEDTPKIWLEDLTEVQYEALQASRKREQEEREERLYSRPSGF